MSLWLPYQALPGQMQTTQGAREEGVQGVRIQGKESVMDGNAGEEQLVEMQTNSWKEVGGEGWIKEIRKKEREERVTS